MTTSDIVTLTVNGNDYSGWKAVRIEAGIERISRSFDVSITISWPGAPTDTPRIQKGDACVVKIGADVVCTGYVDATPISYDASGVTLGIKGRSKTGDLVDCAATGAAQFRGLAAEAVVEKLAGQYGLSVINQTVTGAVITDHQIQQGESVFESLDRIMKARQVLMTDDGSGNVVITQAGHGGNAVDSLAVGVNIFSASANFDYSDVYTNYQVKGAKSGTDDSFGASAAQSVGNATSAVLARQRTLIIKQTGQADSGTCQQRADFEARYRAAKAQEARYKVIGWRQSDGSLWLPNLTVRIDDPVMNVHASLLIGEVIYTLDESGQFAELLVVPPDAFLTDPQDAQVKTGKKKKKSIDLPGW